MEHVPAVANVSTEGMLRYQPECSCGWKGWVVSNKTVAKRRSLEHVGVMRSGNVANNS